MQEKLMPEKALKVPFTDTDCPDDAQLSEYRGVGVMAQGVVGMEEAGDEEAMDLFEVMMMDAGLYDGTLRPEEFDNFVPFPNIN